MDSKDKLAGPWRKIHGAVWLFGLAVLAYKNWWWPGILVLVGLSSLVEAVIMIAVPGAVRSETGNPPAQDPVSKAPGPPPASAALPGQCPRCGAPVLGSKTHPSVPGPVCDYCGARLPYRTA